MSGLCRAHLLGGSPIDSEYILRALAPSDTAWLAS